MGQEHSVDAQAAFDELARLVLSEQSMDGLLQRIAELAKNVVPGASEVSVNLVAKDQATTIAATGPVAVALDERQYDDASGPCLHATQAGTATCIPDMRIETRWPAFARAAVEAGVLSSLSTPILLQQPATAALNIYGTEPGVFSAEVAALAQSFASYAGVAVGNMHLYESTRTLAEQLQAAMESRALIEQAKGVLMGQRRCPAEEAFDVLVTLSQQSNRTLREVAQALVDSTRLTSPGDHLRGHGSRR